ncbi:MAG: ATP-binding protein, partial [Planctomycetota bacterium]
KMTSTSLSPQSHAGAIDAAAVVDHATSVAGIQSSSVSVSSIASETSNASHDTNSSAEKSPTAKSPAAKSPTADLPAARPPAAKSPSSASATANVVGPDFSLAKGGSANETAKKAMANETMRVEVQRLEHLMNLTGELVINKSQFAQVSQLIAPMVRDGSDANQLHEIEQILQRTLQRIHHQHAEDPKWSDTLNDMQSAMDWVTNTVAQRRENRQTLGRLQEAIDQLSRVSSNLQQSVLGTRMVPVGPLLSRFRRVVRDLSGPRGKDVRLQLEGEHTELDKRMVDELGEPLVHLVRNAIDHGLEPTEQRKANGKDPVGTITLAALHRGNHVYLTVSDDGGGIDDQKVRQRIIDRGLLPAETAMAISREEAVSYIWNPGFSTAEQVSDVSGRGVGMDVVKSRFPVAPCH